MTEAAQTREPFERVLSPNVVIRFGYKDGHAVVRVRLPIPLRPWYPVSIERSKIVDFKKPFDRAYDFGIKPEAERGEKIEEFYAREDCRGRFGYRDAHVELEVLRLVWIKLDFPFEEFKLAKAAMDEAHAWAMLPDDVRELQGIAP